MELTIKDVVLNFLIYYAPFGLALALSLFINLYFLNFLRDKCKSWYFYICNIIGLIISVGLTAIIMLFMSEQWQILSLEAFLLFGTTIYSNKKLIKEFHDRNKLYDKENSIHKNIKKNVFNFYINNIIIWVFYIIAIVINLLLKLQLINIEDNYFKFLLNSTEGCVIILLAIKGLFEIITNGKKLNSDLENDG